MVSGDSSQGSPCLLLKRTMRYHRYERGSDLPGSRSYIRTGPIGYIWFGMQGILLTLLILFWPSATLAINYRQWWAWLIFPLVQVFWLWGLIHEIHSSKGRR